MHYEIRLPLKNIEPTVSRLYARSALFLPGMCFAVGTGFVCLILAGLSVPFTFWMTWIIIAFGIVGFLLACLTFKRVEFAQFRNHGGLTILDVARSGPERHKFDEFIRTLIQQIQAAKETASNSGAPAER